MDWQKINMPSFAMNLSNSLANSYRQDNTLIAHYKDKTIHYSGENAAQDEESGIEYRHGSHMIYSN